MSTPAVLVEGVHVRFGDVHALTGIDLEVAPGSTLGVLGHNGAGKTSLIRVLTTLIRPSSGRVLIDGFDVATESDRVRRRIGVTGQYAGLDEFLTGREYLELVARLSTINEMVFTIGRAVLLVAAAVLLGFRFHGNAIDAAAGVVVLMVLAGAMSALLGRIGDHLRRPDVVQFAGMMVMMPLMFVSSAFVPLDTMPGWMRAAANVNPVGQATDALRGAVLGTATVGDVLTAIGAAVAMWGIVAATPSGRR